jgi:hypothetical protein
VPPKEVEEVVEEEGEEPAVRARFGKRATSRSGW